MRCCGAWRCVVVWCCLLVVFWVVCDGCCCCGAAGLASGWCVAALDVLTLAGVAVAICAALTSCGRRVCVSGVILGLLSVMVYLVCLVLVCCWCRVARGGVSLCSAMPSVVWLDTLIWGSVVAMVVPEMLPVSWGPVRGYPSGSEGSVSGCGSKRSGGCACGCGSFSFLPGGWCSFRRPLAASRGCVGVVPCSWSGPGVGLFWFGDIRLSFGLRGWLVTFILGVAPPHSWWGGGWLWPWVCPCHF